MQVVDEQTITAITHWHEVGTVDVVVSNPDDLFGVLPEALPTRSLSHQRTQTLVLVNEAHPKRWRWTNEARRQCDGRPFCSTPP